MRPDFKEINRLLKRLRELDEMFMQMFEKTAQLKEEAVRLCAEKKREQAGAKLADISVDELKNAKAGIHTEPLAQGGYRSLYDLSQATDSQLCQVRGVGEKQVAAIRTITATFLDQLQVREQIRLTDDAADAKNAALVQALARYRHAQAVCEDADRLCGQMHAFLTQTMAQVRIRNAARWLFSFRTTKEETLQAMAALRAFCESEQLERAERFVNLHLEAVWMDEAAAFADLEKNGAAFYALLERLAGETDSRPAVYGSIPAALAASISEVELDLRSFRGDLRGYQRFGAQYVLHQKRVLLGDEMGLGKTVQAIAVMAHLAARENGTHFFVVCPASVMVNWCREAAHFCELRVHLLHGPLLEAAFADWKKDGGVAVTNYESLHRVVDGIDEQMQLSLLVIDEAHYIKNPQAQRTRYIHRLEDEAGYILMMTGTPLENKVDEMCELIGFLRPDMTVKIREHAAMRHIPVFREMLAPVYLRRQARQVLTELPELTYKDEWCALTQEDEAAYAQVVQEGNFTAMRRISFLQDDMSCSAKAERIRQLCAQAGEEGRRVIIYSWFRETVHKVAVLLGDACLGEITGSTLPEQRQLLIDRLSQAAEGSVLVCQIQAGGTGLNIQAASVVILCEPQIKPSLEKQAVARAHRMGQIHPVLVCRLLCEDTVDEAVMKLLEEKQQQFTTYADASVMADAEAELADREWISRTVERERQRYLPALV